MKTPKAETNTKAQPADNAPVGAPTGRPTKYTDRLANLICARLADGESLRTICADPQLPAKSTILNWLKDDEHTEFRRQYDYARAMQWDGIADEILDIADDGSNDWMERRGDDGAITGWRENGEAIQRSRLRVDARKWLLSKMLPKRFGDKVTQELSGPGGEPLEVQTSAYLSPPEVAAAIGKLLTEAEAVAGLNSDAKAPDGERLKRILETGKPVPPGLYAAIQKGKEEPR